MITPRFKLTQDDNFVFINIRAPYSNLRELDIYVDENVFLFSCKPYYLRLILPGNIIENERMKTSFDTDLGEFSFTCPKQNPGEHFKDLDLITKLLVPKVEAQLNEGTINIEVLSENVNDNDVNINNCEDHLNNDNIDRTNLNYGFGFALRARKDFVKISSMFDDVFEIDPCQVALLERRKLRIQYEQGKFNVDHELDFLKDLPNIQYCISEEQNNYCMNGLLDILFAYCYDQRSTCFEKNIESGWTIVKLAATLNWLDVFDSPKEALTTSFRRSVIYPLYRNFNLSQKVFEDLKHIISLDERYIIRILIDIHQIFLKGDCCRYILNNLFIRDYITYIMKWHKDLWQSLVQETLKLEIRKEDLGLNLQEIENDFKLHEKFAAMKLDVERDSDDSEYTSSEDTSDDSSSSEYSTDSETDSDDYSDPAYNLPEHLK